MEWRSSHNLIEAMKDWGFPEPLAGNLGQWVKSGYKAIETIEVKGMDLLSVQWHIGLHPLAKVRVLEEISLRLQKNVEIPAEVNGIDFKSLEGKIRRLTRASENLAFDDRPGRVRSSSASIGKILLQLVALSKSESKMVRDASYLLAYKYFAGENHRQLIPPEELKSLEKEYRRDMSIDPYNSPLGKVNQAYNMLDGRYALLSSIEGESLQWATANWAKTNEWGQASIQWVMSKKQFDLSHAISRAGVEKDKETDAKTIIRLVQGDRVVLPVERGGVRGLRVFYADPVFDRLSIDQKESARMGLYEDLSPSRSPRDNSTDQDRRGRGHK